MRFVLIGAGSVGQALAARLVAAAERVVVVARGERADVLARAGIHLRAPDGEVHVDVAVARSPGDVGLGADDVLVLATKTHQVEGAVREWVDAPVADGGTAGERLPWLLALNGVSAEGIALRYVERVVGVCVWLPSVSLQPGEVVVTIAPRTGVLIVGSVPDGGRDRPLLDAVAARLRPAGFDVHVVDDVIGWKHRKLLTNLGNAVQALCGPGAPGAGAVTEALRAEAADLLAAAGIEYPTAEQEAVWRGDLFADRSVPGVPDDLGGSTWQSLARGAADNEVDFLNGEIVRLARSLGRTAPLNARVQALTRQASAHRRRPGFLTVSELTRTLGIE